jgi:hypothetical protein
MRRGRLGGQLRLPAFFVAACVAGKVRYNTFAAGSLLASDTRDFVL